MRHPAEQSCAKEQAQIPKAVLEVTVVTEPAIPASQQISLKCAQLIVLYPFLLRRLPQW